MITPKQSVVPGETKGAMAGIKGVFGGGGQQQQTLPGLLFKRPGINPTPITPKQRIFGQQPTPQPQTPGPGHIMPPAPQGMELGTGTNAPGGTPAPGAQPEGSTSQKLYDYLKQDLEDNRRSAMSGAVSDASSRGVYYGTPLTTSQGDIQTQYLRGLGSLQAGVLQNEQGNELSRLGIASNLLNNAGQAQGGQIDPMVYQMMGQLFGQSGQPSGQPGATAPAPYQYSPLPKNISPKPTFNLRGITPKPVK